MYIDNDAMDTVEFVVNMVTTSLIKNYESILTDMRINYNNSVQCQHRLQNEIANLREALNKDSSTVKNESVLNALKVKELLFLCENYQETIMGLEAQLNSKPDSSLEHQIEYYKAKLTDKDVEIQRLQMLLEEVLNVPKE